MFQGQDRVGVQKSTYMAEVNVSTHLLKSYTQENSLKIILFAHMNTILTTPIKEQFEERLMTWKANSGKFFHLQDNVERNLQTVSEDLD